MALDHDRGWTFIILPLSKRICPQIVKMNILLIRAKVGYIEGGRNSIITGQVYLVGIVIDTSKGPSALGINLLFLLEGNRSFLKWIYTKSPGWNTIFFLCLLAWSLYDAFAFSILAFMVSWSFWISSSLHVRLLIHLSWNKIKGTQRIQSINYLKWR